MLIWIYHQFSTQMIYRTTLIAKNAAAQNLIKLSLEHNFITF